LIESAKATRFGLVFYGSRAGCLRVLDIMKRAATNFGQSLAIGFILFFFSERLFWSVWRDKNSIGNQMITWLAYSTTTY